MISQYCVVYLTTCFKRSRQVVWALYIYYLLVIHVVLRNTQRWPKSSCSLIFISLHAYNTCSQWIYKSIQEQLCQLQSSTSSMLNGWQKLHWCLTVPVRVKIFISYLTRFIHCLLPKFSFSTKSRDGQLCFSPFCSNTPVCIVLRYQLVCDHLLPWK